MNLASLKFSSKEVIRSVMDEANFTQIWLVSEDVVMPFTIKYFEDYLKQQKSEPKSNERECFSMKTDSQGIEFLQNNCLNKNHFICYKKQLEIDLKIDFKSSSTRRAFNTLLFHLSFILLFFNLCL